MSKITGEVDIDLCGEVYSIRFDWDALAAVKDAHGDAPNLFDSDVLASVASMGMKKRHPELTPEKIRELSPPLVPFANTVQQALQYAYFGGEALPDDDEKKSPQKTGLLSRISRLFSAE